MFRMIGILRAIVQLHFVTVVAGVLLLSFYLACAVSAKEFLRSKLEEVLGVDVRIHRADIDFLKTRILFLDLQLGSPPGFPPVTMAKVALLELDLDPGHSSPSKLRFHEMALDIRELVITRTPEGRLNWFSMKVLDPLEGQSPDPAGGRAPKALEIGKFQIELRAGQFVDYSRPVPLKLNFELQSGRVVYRDLGSLREMARVIGWEIYEHLDKDKLTELFGPVQEKWKKFLGPRGDALKRRTLETP